jgi:glycerol-3-phosphate dehydrogenase subunit B
VNIAVIGAGVAGAAAAHELARQGARPTVFHAQAGASALYSGALDFEAWDRVHELSPIEPELARFCAALGAWELGPAAARIATLDGNLRPTRGRDRALLDLEPLAGQRVAVVELERDDWDARLLARSYSASAWAKQTETVFEPVRVRALEHHFERRISSYDFAAQHDVPERASFLLTALKISGVSPAAWLCGPWLGVERAVATELSAALGVPVGETTSAPGGAAGARFESARDRLLSQIALVERARVLRIESRGRGYRLETEAGDAGEFSSVVLATGGVAAGGIVLERSFERRGGAGFRLSFAAPVSIAVDGEISEGVSSLSSPDFVERGMSVLLAVGIAASSAGAALGAPGLFVAGDALAERPRSALFAAQSGVTAARGALAHARGNE